MVLAGDAAKMAKSTGNVFQLHEALDRFGSEAVIGFLISGHYRQPIAFGAEALERAAASNERVRDFFREVEPIDGDRDPRVEQAREAFLEALADDFNTPRAMAELYDLIAEGHRRPLAGAHETLAELLGIVGLATLTDVEEEVPDEAAQLLAERERARAERDFARADEARDRLGEMGWLVRDTPAGARLVRGR